VLIIPEKEKIEKLTLIEFCVNNLLFIMTAIKSGVSKRQRDKMMLRGLKEHFSSKSHCVYSGEAITPEKAYADIPPRRIRA